MIVIKELVYSVQLKAFENNNPNFLPITDKNKVYVGGDQNWYPKKFSRANGCSPVAAANITSYLASQDKSYERLYPYPSLDKRDFLLHMEDAYKHFRPGILGEISLTGWARKMESFSSKKGVNLKKVEHEKPISLENTRNYLKRGLASNCPVATLNLDILDYKNNFGWHWMVITDYSEDSKGDAWIGVSSWGKRYILNYEKYFKTMRRLLKGGMVYFK